MTTFFKFCMAALSHNRGKKGGKVVVDEKDVNYPVLRERGFRTCHMRFDPFDHVARVHAGITVRNVFQHSILIRCWCVYRPDYFSADLL